MSDICSELKRGYLVWLEPTHLHFHTGGRVGVKALWGLSMQKDGIGNPENWEALVTDPAGNALNTEIAYGNGLYAVINFQAGEEGLYHVLLKNAVRVCKKEYYEQQASLLVPVGHHLHGRGAVIGKGLEILLLEFKEFHPGDTLLLQILMDGRPVPGVDVKATYHLYEGTDYPHIKSTDNEGKVFFTFDNKGHWMFVAQYWDKLPESETKRNCISTFVVPGVR